VHNYREIHINISKKIRKEFDKIRPLFIGTLEYTKIIEILTPVLNKFRAKPLMLLENIDKRDCIIGGLYDSQMTRIPITLELKFSANSNKIKMSKGCWNSLLFDIYSILLHEHVHLGQMRNRRFEEFTMFQPLNSKMKMTEHQEYLAEWDEIDAYGLSIALEILYEFPNDDPFEVLRNINKKPTLTYGMYMEDFAGCDWRDIREMLLKKTYRWLHIVIENDMGFNK